RPEAQGLRHLAFAVADVAAAIRHLAAHQVVCEPVRVDEFTGRRFTFFADPDGLPLELYEVRSTPAEPANAPATPLTSPYAQSLLPSHSPCPGRLRQYSFYLAPARRLGLLRPTPTLPL
ncbi:MAG: hypothetical protein EOO59_15030, partial [Hymenobacter sp.]